LNVIRALGTNYPELDLESLCCAIGKAASNSDGVTSAAELDDAVAATEGRLLPRARLALRIGCLLIGAQIFDSLGEWRTAHDRLIKARTVAHKFRPLRGLELRIAALALSVVNRFGTTLSPEENKHLVEEERNALDRAIAADPQHPWSLILLSHHLRRHGQAQEAEQFLRDLTAVVNDNGEAWFALGSCLFEQGKDEACAAFRKAIYCDSYLAVWVPEQIRVRRAWQERATC